LIIHNQLIEEEFKPFKPKNPDLGENLAILAVTGFQQLTYPKICSLAVERRSFQQLTSYNSAFCAGESADFFKIKFLSHGESVLHA
jgi:hypothetical protein